MNTGRSPMSDVDYGSKPMLAWAGIADYTWHDNRHTTCSRWVMEGVPLVAVARYSAHSTIQLTMRYAHIMLGANQITNSVADAFCANTSRKGAGTDANTEVIFPQGRISL